MKIAYVSDLHIQDLFFDKDILSEWREHISRWQNINKCDVLVLAGDIFEGDQRSNIFFKIVEGLFEHVIYVPGNHEYWKDDLLNPKFQWKLGMKNTKLCIHNDVFEINGYKFLCGTMWYDAYLASSVPNHEARYNDFFEISNYTLSNVQYLNDEFISTLETTNNIDIVVSHFAPRQLVKVNSLDPFYYTNCERFMNDNIKLWFYGHTHTVVDYVFGKTRIVSNALGHFDPFTCQLKVVEI